MSFPAPFDRFRGEVLPEWIDYNGHMNLAYYTVLFDQATDLLFDELGLGLDYRRDRKLGTFVAETHNLYERELLVGARVRVATQILGDRRQAPASRPRDVRAQGWRALRDPGIDVLCMSISRRAGSPVSRRNGASGSPRWTAAHAALPRPDWAGRRIGLPGKS